MGENVNGSTRMVTILLSGILKVKIPESKQNLIKSPWRERYCVLEEDPTKRSLVLKIFKANATKSAPKLYLTIFLAPETASVSVWKDSNIKSAIFYVRQGQEIGFSCSSTEECDRWVSTLNDQFQNFISAPPSNSAEPLTALHVVSQVGPILASDREHKEEEREDVSSVSDSIQSQPPRLAHPSPRSQGVIGGNIEPSRIEKSRSASLSHLPPAAAEPINSPMQLPNQSFERSPSLNRISSKLADRLDTPLTTSPLGSSAAPSHHAPTPFWLGLDSSTPHPRVTEAKSNSPLMPMGGSTGNHLISPPRSLTSPSDRKGSGLPTSPVRREIDPLARMRLEVSELIELNNSLNEKIDTLTEEKQSAAKEFQSERSLFQQRVDDLKTRNLLTNEECRTLREDLHRVKRELKETIARQEEESLKHAVDGMLPQQLETYRQLSESLTRENLKLSTDIAKLGKQISEREGHEKKSMATVKLLLEKNASLESELVTLQERQEQQRRAHEEVAQERDECRHKLTDSMTRCKRAETELRKLQSRVHEEIQNEVSVETERMLLLEEECSRLQKEIFTSRNESNEWEIECLRVTQELSELQESMNANSLKNVSELTHELEAVMEKLQRAEETAEELKAQLKQKETEVAQQREELSASVDVSKSELKEMKRSWKQQLQTAEGKISKMQSEILRLNTELVDSERRCANHKERVSKLETEASLAHDTRMAERQSHSKLLHDCQLQLETVTASSSALEGKSNSLEQANRALQRSLSESKTQLEDLEQRHHETLKALKTEKAQARQLQDSLEMLKLDREQDQLQFEEKLRRINSASGESKQTLLEIETQLSETTTQLFHQRSSKEKLTLSLQDAEEKCEHIKSEVKRLQDVRKQEHQERDSQLSKLKKALQESEAVVIDLRTQLGDKNSQLEELSLTLDKARRDLETQREWRTECQSLEQRLKQASEQLQEVGREKQELERRLTEESDLTEELQKTVTKLKTRCGDLQSSLETSQHSAEKLERSLQVSSRTKESLETELQEATQSYKDCELRLSRKCLELKESLERTSQSHLELVSKNAELQNLQLEQESLRKAFKILEESLKSSELCVETVNFSCKTLHEEVESLNKQCEDWKQSCGDLERALQETQLEVSVLKTENAALHRRSGEMSAELSRFEELRQHREEERRDQEELLGNLKEQLLAAETVKQELSRELSHKSQSISEVNELYRDSQAEAQASQAEIAELRRSLAELTETSETSQRDLVSVRSELSQRKNAFQEVSFAAETLKAEHGQLLSVLEAHKNELEHLRDKEKEYWERIQELDASVAEKDRDVLRLEDQNQQFSATIVQQERSLQEKLKEATAPLEDQLSAIYGRLSKTTAQHTSTTRGIRSALQTLNDTQSLLAQWTSTRLTSHPDSPSSRGSSPPENPASAAASSSELSAEPLELSVTQVHQEVQLLSADMTKLRALCVSLLNENASFSLRLTAFSRELPSAIRERCVREICQLETMDTVTNTATATEGKAEAEAEEETDASALGLRGDLNQLSLLQRQLRSSQEISSLFCTELLRREENLLREHQEELQQSISNLEAHYQQQLLTLQRELSSRELVNSSLAEEIQRRELASCRLLREKEEIERVLRGKLSSSEYQAVVGSRGPSLREESPSAAPSDSRRPREETPMSVPPFDLSSIYRTQPQPLSLEEEMEAATATPHLPPKRNRGASVSVNTSRKQLFPDTPHAIPAGKGRHRPSPYPASVAPAVVGSSNGRIFALLGKSSPH